MKPLWSSFLFTTCKTVPLSLLVLLPAAAGATTAEPSNPEFNAEQSHFILQADSEAIAPPLLRLESSLVLEPLTVESVTGDDLENLTAEVAPAETVDASEPTAPTLDLPSIEAVEVEAEFSAPESLDTESTNPAQQPEVEVTEAETPDTAASNSESLDTDSLDAEAPDTEVEVTDDSSDPEAPNAEAPKPATDPAVETTEADQTEDLSADERLQLLIEGDRLFEQGRFFEAEQLYRKAKRSFTGVEIADRPEPITDPALLSPAGQVYWREAETGREMNLETRMRVPLELLVAQYPEFIPGHIRYAEVLMAAEQADAALDVLERATTLYPDQAELMQARVTALATQEEWLEAAIAARQFAVFNPDDPTAPAFQQNADLYQEEFESDLRGRLRRNAIANVFTGAISYALTGGLLGPISAVQTTALMLRGESTVGENLAERAAEEFDLIEDEAVVAYVNELGQRLASVAGRDEFEYEFYVIREAELNAFALPGGKIFVNAGAITEANSEAELAGLLAHELAHAVLSHGFQMVTGGNLTANLLQFVPYGRTATNLLVLNYSRDMERQADTLGTQILANAGYAADGLRNLMVTLQDHHPDRPVFAWLSTHPNTEERIRNMERQIDENGYNRYTFEGVERHQAIQERVRQLMGETETDKVAE